MSGAAFRAPASSAPLPFRASAINFGIPIDERERTEARKEIRDDLFLCPASRVLKNAD